MLVNQELFGSDYLTRWNFLNTIVMNMPLMATLICILLRIRTIPSPMTWLVVVPARHVAWRNTGAALARTTLTKRNGISLAKPSLG
jgi:hypothetical protein